MFSSLLVEVSNQPTRGGILIKSAPIVDSIENITKLRILKKNPTTNEWFELFQKAINAVDDLELSLLDILTVAGTVYNYYIELSYGDSIVESEVFSDIKCDFNGLFIGDFEQQYIAGLNFKTESVKRNRSVEYVSTLYGRYPYRVSNADTDYYTGTSSGLFLELVDNNNGGKSFDPDMYHVYYSKVMDFLCNNQNKILKTHDGFAWYVSIDSNPTEIYSDHWGMNAIQFSWTEIGELPTTGLVGVAS